MERADLIAIARTHLAALAANQPGDAPLATDIRATENGSAVEPGDGLWRSVRGFPGYPAFLADEDARTVLVFGAVDLEEGRRPFALRLVVSGMAIMESEAIVGRTASGFFADVEQLVRSDVIYDAPVPPERAVGREGLQAVSDSYWVALGQSDGSLVNVNYRADRYADGKKVTNNLEILLSPDRAVHSVQSLLTATRPAHPVVREKRFVLLDPPRGVSASIAMVDFADDPNHPRPDTGSFYIMNAIKVVDREIRIIDAIHRIMPRGSTSGWG